MSVVRAMHNNFGRGTRPPWMPTWTPRVPDVVVALPEQNTWNSIRPADSPPNGYTFGPPPENTPFYMVDAWPKIIDDYGGGVWNPWWSQSRGGDQLDLGSVQFHGGGHSATNCNAIAAFDLNSLLYHEVLPGSLNCYPVDTLNCEYADGSPCSPHTYDTLNILGPSDGYAKGLLVTPLRGGTTVSNYSTRACHAFDYADPAAGWYRKSSAPVSGFGQSIGYASCWDSDLRRFWWQGASNGSGYLPYYDWDNAEHRSVTVATNRSYGDGHPDTRTMRYVSARRLVVLGDHASGDSNKARRFYYIDTQNENEGLRQATLTGDTMPASSFFAWDWVPRLGGFVCMVGSGARDGYYVLQPAATLTDAWLVTYKPFAAGTTMSIGYSNGDRFFYHHMLDVFMGKANAASVHCAFRPS